MVSFQQASLDVAPQGAANNANANGLRLVCICVKTYVNVQTDNTDTYT
jgi:hypothetical protein